MAGAGGAGRALPVGALILLTAAVVAWGNVNALLEPDVRRWVLVTAGPAIAAALMLGARYRGLSWSELGVDGRSLLPGAAVGVAIGLLLAAVPLAFVLLAPLVTGEPVQSGNVEGASGADVAERVLLHVLVGTAVSEETIFRGALFGLWAREGGSGTAFAVTSVAFLLWHLVVSFQGAQNAGIVDAPALVGAAYVVTLAGVFVGGLFFAWLRWQTGSLATPIAVHWTVNSAMLIALWARG